MDRLEVSDLASWLLEQIAEDERLATAAKNIGDGRWQTDCPLRLFPEESIEPWYVNHDHADDVRIEGDSITIYDEGGHNHDQAEHIASWDPARVLAECDAKRRIIDLHNSLVVKLALSPFDPETGLPRPQEYEVLCDVCGWATDDPTSACQTVRLLALPYADREGYQESWRP